MNQAQKRSSPGFRIPRECQNFEKEDDSYFIRRKSFGYTCLWDYGVISNHKYSDHLMEMMNRLEDILVLVPSFYSTLGRIRHGYITTGGKEKQ